MLLQPHDGTGHLFTMEEFKKYCKDGMFIDDDGTGYYSTKDRRSNIRIQPSHISLGCCLTGITTENESIEFTHVTWYNR